MAKRPSIMEAGDLAWICEQLALVQKSGIPLGDGIALLADGDYLPRQTRTLQQLDARLKEHVPLSDAFEQIGSFPAYMIHMTRIGEATGNLDTVLSDLAAFYLSEDQLRRRVRGALIYPAILTVLMVAVIVLLIVRVLPVFGQILSSFGGRLPAFSEALLNFSAFIGHNAAWLIPLILVLLIALWLIVKRTPRGRRTADRLKLTLPLIGPINRKVYAARFASALGGLLGAGIDMDQALGMTSSVMDNRYVEERIDQARDSMRQGNDVFQALKSTDLFPPLFARMLELGSRTGELESVMSRIARSYASEIEGRLARLTGLVEPILVVVLALIIGIILMSVMLPLAEILSSIG